MLRTIGVVSSILACCVWVVLGRGPDSEATLSPADRQVIIMADTSGSNLPGLKSQFGMVHQLLCSAKDGLLVQLYTFDTAIEKVFAAKISDPKELWSAEDAVMARPKKPEKGTYIGKALQEIMKQKIDTPMVLVFLWDGEIADEVALRETVGELVANPEISVCLIGLEPNLRPHAEKVFAEFGADRLMSAGEYDKTNMVKRGL